MSPYERLIKVIREEGAKNNPPMIELGTMVSEKRCDIGGVILEAEDLYIAEHLMGEYEVKISMDARADINSTSSNVKINNQKAMCKQTLKAGDVVLVYRLNEERYVIIEKVVGADVSI